MAAVHYYTRRDASWSDHPKCVPPTVLRLCVELNDTCADGEREELIGPHLFAPVGISSDPEHEQARAFLCADMAVRVWAPMALDAVGLFECAALLRALPRIVDAETASAAAAAAHATVADADAATIKRGLLNLILECCAIGDCVEVCPTKTREQVIAEACI